jgi:hypothetical protein
MIPAMRLALLGGCVIVTALVSPTSARVVTEDLLGPNALRPASADGVDLARIGIDELAAFVEATSDDEQDAVEQGGVEQGADERVWVDHEAGHDAP